MRYTRRRSGPKRPSITLQTRLYYSLADRLATARRRLRTLEVHRALHTDELVFPHVLAEVDLLQGEIMAMEQQHSRSIATLATTTLHTCWPVLTRRQSEAWFAEIDEALLRLKLSLYQAGKWQPTEGNAELQSLWAEHMTRAEEQLPILQARAAQVQEQSLIELAVLRQLLHDSGILEVALHPMSLRAIYATCLHYVHRQCASYTMAVLTEGQAVLLQRSIEKTEEEILKLHQQRFNEHSTELMRLHQQNLLWYEEMRAGKRPVVPIHLLHTKNKLETLIDAVDRHLLQTVK